MYIFANINKNPTLEYSTVNFVKAENIYHGRHDCQLSSWHQENNQPDAHCQTATIWLRYEDELGKCMAT